MGAFYTNYTLRGPNQDAVARFLIGRSAIVTPEQQGCVVVYDQLSDEQNQDVITEFAAVLSGEFRCPVLAVLNHDDDILWYNLYLNGELKDEYNSCPGYFDDSDNRSPSGGDAQTLCSAFDAKDVSRVETILRMSLEDEDGYVFASERHADLVDALGLPTWAVGTGFEILGINEFPEGLTDEDLIRTRMFALPELGGDSQAGYYKLVVKKQPNAAEEVSIPIGWVPQLWADLQCGREDLSDEFWQHTAVTREQVARIGFAEVGFKKLTRVLNPNYLDNGGINYLHPNQCHYAQIIYNKARIAARGIDIINVIVSFTAVFEGKVMVCTNNPSNEAEALPEFSVIRIASNDVSRIYQEFLANLKLINQPPKNFENIESLRAWSDGNAFRLFDRRIHGGSFVKMSDYEVAVARRKLPSSIGR